MVIDSSAILCILQGENDSEKYVNIISAESEIYLSVVNALEIRIVLASRYGDASLSDLNYFLLRSEISLEPVSLEQYEYAQRAFQLYGKGRHAAQLNFGDCFAYALCKSKNEKLLFKGNDFNHTDLDIIGV